MQTENKLLENKYAMQPYLCGALPQASSKRGCLMKTPRQVVYFEFLYFKLVLYLANFGTMIKSSRLFNLIKIDWST
jgi:hypothetical protein